MLLVCPSLITRYTSDTFAVIQESTLLPTTHVDPANYESAGTRTIDRDSNINDICDFVVEYVNSDVLVSALTSLFSPIINNHCRGFFQIGT